MSASLARFNPHAGALALWARLEVSAVAAMALAVVLCAAPLLEAAAPAALEDALPATANAFAAFVIAELVCLPLATWLGEKRSRRLVRPLGVVLGLLATVGGMSAGTAATRAAWYALAGVGAELARAWIMDAALRSPLLRRGAELLVLGATCLAVLGLALGAYVAASGPAQDLRTLLVCSAGQATVVFLAVAYTLWPPAPSSFPTG
jgi:MFS family permease